MARRARHNCALWTSLGFSCPGGVRGKQRGGIGEAEEPPELPRVIPVHDTPRVEPAKLARWVYIRILEKVKRAVKLAKPEDRVIRIMEPVRVRDIPVKEIARSVPIPEIIMTGAAAAAIMAADRVFGARAEEMVNRAVRSQGRSVRMTGRPTTAGVGFRFNAAAELEGKMQLLRRFGAQGSGDGDFFPGILG